MDLDPLLLSRIQFAFTISFHIIFPAFTIGLAAWLATIEGVRLATANPVYRRVFDFWLRVFAVSFGMGVVSGIVMAFQFGTNWSVLSEKMGAIQGPLLGYEVFTAFLLEATFLGVVLFGRDRVPPRLYFVACCMISLGTMTSSFWILANNSWMQVPIGHQQLDGDHRRAGVPDPLDAHAAGRVSHHRDVRDGDRCLVHSTQHASRGGASHDALGNGSRCAPHLGPALLRAPQRQVRLRASAYQVRGHRSTLAEPAARHGGVVRDP
jgi:hypothetical protein